jgi:hypothetical protein
MVHASKRREEISEEGSRRGKPENFENFLPSQQETEHL